MRVLPVSRVVADDAAVAARLQSVDRPLVHFVADRRLGEEDAAVVGDVEVVGQAQAAVVVDRAQLRLVSSVTFSTLRVRRDAVQAHAADADVEVVVAVEGHAERLAADVGEDLHALVVGREEADHVAVAGAGVEVVVAVEDHVLRGLDAAEADQRHVAQLVVQRVRRCRCRAAVDGAGGSAW